MRRMPISFSPSKLRRRHQRRSGSIDKTCSSKETRNMDSAVWQKFWENTKKGEASNEGRPLTPALPYSKDFGTFDLTLCEGSDGRCLVLVEYDQRMFLNGKQIFISDDGTVSDSTGLSDRRLSTSFQQALEAKYDVRRKDGESRMKQDRQNTAERRKSETMRRQNRDVRTRRDSDSRLKEKPNVRFRAEPESNRETFSTQTSAATESNKPRNLKTEMHSLEASFSESIAHLCSLIVELSERDHADTESAKSEDYALDQHAEYLVNMLTRLSDQFQSMVGLSSTLRGDTPQSGVEYIGTAGAKREKKAPQREEPESSSEEGVVISVWSREDTNGATYNNSSRGERNGSHSSSECSREMVQVLRTENQQLREEVEALDGDMSRAQRLLEELENRLALATKERDEVQKKCVTKPNSRERVQYEESREEIPNAKKLLVNYFEENCGHNTAFCGESDSESHDESTRTDAETPVEGAAFSGSRTSLKSEIRRLKTVYDDVGTSLEFLNEENIRLRANIMSLRKENQYLHEKLDNEKKQNVTLRMDVERFDGLNAELEERLSTLEKTKAALEIEIESLREDQTERAATGRILERKLSESMANCRLLEEQQSVHQKDLEQVAKKHLEESTRAARFAKTGAELEVEVTELRSANEKLSVENHLLRAENDTNSSAREKAECLNRQLEEDLRLARGEVAESAEDVRRLAHRNEVLQETISSLEEGNNELTQRVVKLEATKSALEKQTDDMRTNLNLVKRENSELKGQYQELELENHHMKDTIVELSETNADIRARLKRLDRENTDVTGRMHRLVRAKSELHGMLQKLTGLNTDIETRFERMDSEYEELEKKLKDSDDILKGSCTAT